MSLRVIMFEGKDTDKLLSDLLSNVEYFKLDVGVYEVSKNTNIELSKMLYIPQDGRFDK